MAEGRPPGADPRDGVDLLRGLLICGLVLTAGTGEGWLHASIRGALPVVMGLAFGVAIAGAERGGRRVSPLWMLHLLATWLLTLWPGMWGNREVVRTCAIAGCAVILLRGVGVRARAGLGVAVVAVAVAAWLPDAPHWLRVGTSELLYALGVAWPRGLAEVATDAALFLFACGASARRGARALAGWRGIAVPLRAFGRMPLTALAGQSVIAGLLLAVPEWDRPGLRWVALDSALIAQLAFAAAWLRSHGRGPCEEVLALVHTAMVTLGSSLRRVFVAVPGGHSDKTRAGRSAQRPRGANAANRTFESRKTRVTGRA